MPIEFWYEFASTYSYLSALRIEERARAAGVELLWRPFLLGPIFAAQGWDNSPFNLYPAKGHYMWRDVARQAERLGLAFRRPSVFPRNGLLAARIALVGVEQGWVADFTRGVYRAAFAEDREISDWNELRPILQGLDLDPDRIRSRAESPENKTALRLQTEQAQSRGIFGAPSFLVSDELFWGDDRLAEALEWAKR